MAKCKGISENGENCRRIVGKVGYCHAHIKQIKKDESGNNTADKIKAAIIALVRQGKKPPKAARQLGVNPSTFQTWKDRDGQFEQLLAIAEEEYLHDLLLISNEGAKTDHRHAFKKLQVRDSETWGDVQKIETKQEVTIDDLRDKDEKTLEELSKLFGDGSKD